MAGTAMRTGAAAAAGRGGGRGHFPSAFKAERRQLLLYPAAFTVGAFDLVLGVKNDLLEIFLALLALKFENRHSFFLRMNYSKPNRRNARI
jgi:hypothetical protein